MERGPLSVADLFMDKKLNFCNYFRKIPGDEVQKALSYVEGLTFQEAMGIINTWLVPVTMVIEAGTEGVPDAREQLLAMVIDGLRVINKTQIATQVSRQLTDADYEKLFAYLFFFLECRKQIVK